MTEVCNISGPSLFTVLEQLAMTRRIIGGCTENRYKIAPMRAIRIWVQAADYIIMEASSCERASYIKPKHLELPKYEMRNGKCTVQGYISWWGLIPNLLPE